MTMQERYLALTEKRKIPEVIVVEGKDDTANLRRFYELDWSGLTKMKISLISQRLT